jgi:hypothetical protein
MDLTFKDADRLAKARNTCVTTFPGADACVRTGGIWTCRAVVANAAGSCELRTDEGIYRRFFRPSGTAAQAAEAAKRSD